MCVHVFVPIQSYIHFNKRISFECIKIFITNQKRLHFYKKDYLQIKMCTKCHSKRTRLLHESCLDTTQGMFMCVLMKEKIIVQDMW